MVTDLTKKAAEMLLQGASLLGEPCPYCSGIRVMKNGHALCVSCGSEPQKREIPQQEGVARPDLKSVLEDKLATLSIELEKEPDHGKQQEILTAINSILEAMEKLNKYSSPKHSNTPK